MSLMTLLWNRNGTSGLIPGRRVEALRLAGAHARGHDGGMPACGRFWVTAGVIRARRV